VANEDKSARYQRHRRHAAIATATLDAALLAGVLVTGLSRALADAAAAAWSPAPAATLAFVLPLLAARTMLILPVAYASEVVHERRYGRTLVTVVRWLRAYLWRALALAVLLAGAAVVVQVAASWNPAAWWVSASAVLAAAVVAGAALLPALTARSAAELAPIRHADLAARLTALAARAGAGSVPVLEWKAGSRPGGATALLAGIGPARRILVTDTVLDTHADDEVEVIVAHELAHHRRGDAWWTAALTAGALTLELYVAAHVLPVAAGVFALTGPADIAALPLIALVCGLVAAALMPIANVVSRAQERRADRDALNWTRNPNALVRALKRLSAEHLVEERPSLLAGMLFHRHPGVSERIAAAEQWENTVPQPPRPEPVAWSPPPGLAATSLQGSEASVARLDSPPRTGAPAPAVPGRRADGRRAGVRPAGRGR
jgi:STE24 endopeptidase